MKALFFLNLVTLTVCAAPSGFQLMKGDAQSPLLQENEWVIQSGDKAIVHWDNFSIAKDETVRFQQLDRSSIILNRVTGSDPSHILGALRSNGSVYLINPHGLLVGPDACIDAASFIGSCLDVLDQDFLDQKSLLFSGEGVGTVVNFGTIKCEGGFVSLIGRVIRNEGTISAKEGAISLAVGSEVLLQPQDRPAVLIKTSVQGNEEPGSALIQNGTLEAFEIELKAGSSIYSRAIQCSGVIEASSIREVGGRIELFCGENECHVEGKLFAKNKDGIGGKIHILGEQIHLHDRAEIDVSGQSGGGQILVGGDFQGKNPHIVNAKQTFVDENVFLKADALEQGNGGRVIVWSDDATVYLGNISAQGGSFSGDGGFVEVSGKRLQFEGKVNLSPSSDPTNKVGTLLLDPINIIISKEADAGGIFGPTTGMTCFYIPYASSGSAADVISTDTLSYLLNSPCNVTISTIGSAGPGTGTIVVSDPLSWSAATQLTLIADSTITLNAPIANTNPSTGFTAIDLQANPNNLNGFEIVTGGITLNNGGMISTLGGDISLKGNGGAAHTAGCCGIYILSGGGINVGKGGTARLAGTGGAIPNRSNASNHGIYLLGGTIIVNDEARLFMNGNGGGFPGGAGGSNHGIFFGSGLLKIGDVSGAFATISGTGGNGASGVNYGVMYNGSLLSLNEGSTLLFSDCKGGGRDGGTSSQNVGIYLNAPFCTTSARSKIQFENITGGGSGPSSDNYGMYIFSASCLSASEISMGPNDTTHIRGSITATGSDNHGIVAYGPIGSNAAGNGTKVLSLIGIGGEASKDGTSCGVRVVGKSSALNIADGGTMNIIGYGGGFAGSGGGSNMGIELLGGTIKIGNSTGATAIFSGKGGNGLVGSHHGISVSPSDLILNGSSTLRFSNCTGGGTAQSDWGYNYGVSFGKPIQITSVGSRIEFENITGGGSGNAPGNCGIAINDVVVSAPEIRMGGDDKTHIQGGNTSGTGNAGLLIKGANGFLGAPTTVLSLVAIGGGSGTEEHGIYVVDGAGISDVSALKGMPGAAGLDPSYGMYINGKVVKSSPEVQIER